MERNLSFQDSKLCESPDGRRNGNSLSRYKTNMKHEQSREMNTMSVRGRPPLPNVSKTTPRTREKTTLKALRENRVNTSLPNKDFLDVTYSITDNGNMRDLSCPLITSKDLEQSAKENGVSDENTSPSGEWTSRNLNHDKTRRNIENINEDWFICETCSKDFDEEDRTPRVLPCLHTVCQACVTRRIYDAMVTCPICRAKYALPSESVKDMPKENTIRTLKDVVGLIRPSYKTMCRDCPDKGKAMFYCCECYVFLCSECRKAHSRNIITRDHNTLSFDQLKNGCGMECFQRKQTCDVHGHEGQPLTYFCETKACFTPMCKMCVVLFHDPKKGHAVKKLSDIYQHQKMCVSDLLNSITDKIEVISSVAGDAESEIQEIEKKEIDINEEIDNEINNGIQLLEKRRLVLKETVRTKCKHKKEVLRKQKDLLKYNLRIMKNANEFSLHEIQYAMPAEFVVLTESITGRLISLAERPFDSIPLENSCLSFDKAAFHSDFSDLVSRLGQIRSTSVYPLDTKVETFDIAVDCSSEALKIILYDLKGLPQVNGIKHIRVAIKNPQGNVSEGLVDADKGISGGYRVFYAPRTVGDHVAYVYVLGRLVKEDGFIFKVRPAGEIDKYIGDIVCPGFICNVTTVHPDLSITADGRKLKSNAKLLNPKGSNRHLTSPRGMNSKWDKDPSASRQNKATDTSRTGHSTSVMTDDPSSSRQLHKYCGVIGSKPFNTVGRFYYEVRVSYNIQVTLTRNALVFEIGIGRQASIRDSFYVGSQMHAWSFSVERCSDHNQLCHKFRHNRTLMTHNPVSKDTAGTIVTKHYGFMLDTASKEWTVIDCSSKQVLYCFQNVDFSEPLWHAMGTYNPFSVYVEMQLKTGSAIENIPEIVQ